MVFWHAIAFRSFIAIRTVEDFLRTVSLSLTILTSSFSLFTYAELTRKRPNFDLYLVSLLFELLIALSSNATRFQTSYLHTYMGRNRTFLRYWKSLQRVRIARNTLVGSGLHAFCRSSCIFISFYFFIFVITHWIVFIHLISIATTNC